MASRKAKSTVHIHVSCEKLKNKDLTSKSDPCCILYIKKHDDDDDDDGGWEEVGRTETIQNCLDPHFSHHLEAEYEFDKRQKVRFEVYDIDNKSEKLTDDDFLGQLETTLAEVVCGSPLTKPLHGRGKGKDKPAGGTITLRVQETAGHQHHGTLKLLFKGLKLENKDTVGKSDPFLEFWRKTDDDKWQVVHKTEVVNNNLNPTWKPFEIKADQLCGGDFNNPIRVDCKDFDSNGKHDLIGSFTTSAAELVRNPKGHQWHCINHDKEKKKKYEHSGTIVMEFCELQKD